MYYLCSAIENKTHYKRNGSAIKMQYGCKDTTKNQEKQILTTNFFFIMATIKLGNTIATEKLVHEITNLLPIYYDFIYSEARHGYIFVQLSSCGHYDVRLNWDKKSQTWSLSYATYFPKSVNRTGLSQENVIEFIRNN